MKYSFLYSLKIWLSTACVAPVFLIILLFFPDRDNFDASSIGVYPILIAFELMLSLFTWLIFWVAIELIIRVTSQNVRRRCIISILGVVLTILTFRIFISFTEATTDGFLMILLLSNTGCIALGSWYFNIGPKANPGTLTDPLPSIRPHEN